MQEQAKKYGIPMKRWPATYGKDIKWQQLRSLGIGHAMVRSNRFDEGHRDLRNLGIIGCFVSTRRLLMHLNLRDYPRDAGHLILEDDVVLPRDLLSENGVLASKLQFVPSDWDLFYLGIWNPTGVEIGPGVVKLKSADGVNLGTFAYIIRHGAIPKVLKWLTYMVDALDEQYSLKFDEWNAYALTPNLVIMDVPLNDDSSINKIN